MSAFKIKVLFQGKRTVSPYQVFYRPLDEDTLVRLLRNFEPIPTRLHIDGSGCVASFSCEAETPFAANIIAVDLFDKLKVHCNDGEVQPHSWITEST
jgi:hypothetical protein